MLHIYIKMSTLYKKHSKINIYEDGDNLINFIKMTKVDKY